MDRGVRDDRGRWDRVLDGTFDLGRHLVGLWRRRVELGGLAILLLDDVVLRFGRLPIRRFYG